MPSEERDSARTHMLTKFICTECGENLHLSNEKPKASKCSEGEPTGAACSHVNIYIYPCYCQGEAKRKLKTLQDIFKESDNAN